MEQTRLFLITAMVIVGCGCVGLLVVRLSNPFLRGLGWLSGTFFLGALSTLLLNFDGRIPRFFTVIVANFCTLLAYIILQAAILELIENKRRFTLLSVALAIVWLIQAIFFTYAHDSHQMRVAFGCILLAVQVFQSTFILVRRPEYGVRLPIWYTAILLFAFGVFNVARAGIVMVQGISPNIFAPSLLQLISVIVYLFAALGVGFGFFWTTTAKLRLTLERLASTDPLTGTWNRRYFRLSCEKELLRCLRAQETFSLLVADIDHFKSVNDRYGHMAGDTILCSIATCIQANLRGSDILGRWGGEEFVILLPDCEAVEAKDVAERVRAGIEAWSQSPTATNETPIHVTLSLGIATFRGTNDPLDDVFRRGDAALYQAKAAGRNRALAME